MRGKLTAIHVPDETEEAGRDLVRCRDDIRRDALRWRHRVLKLLARHGRVYLAGKNWSQAHWRWIRSQQFGQPPLQRAVEASLSAIATSSQARSYLEQLRRIPAIETLLSFQRRRARRRRLRAGHSGCVTVIQRFGGGLNLNIHFHILVIDGDTANSFNDVMLEATAAAGS